MENEMLDTLVEIDQTLENIAYTYETETESSLSDMSGNSSLSDYSGSSIESDSIVYFHQK